MEKAANVMRIVAMVGAILTLCFILWYYVYICIIYPTQMSRRKTRKVHVTDSDTTSDNNAVTSGSNQDDVEDESKYEDLDGYDIESNYSDQGGEVFVKRAYKCVYNSICV